MAEATHCLVVTVPAELAEAMSAFLFDLGAQGLEERELPAEVELVVYGSHPELSEMERALKEHVRELSSATSAARGIEWSLSEAPGDWASEWAESLSPTRITQDLVVCPFGKSAPPTLPPTRVITLEVDLVFGYGDHATTRLAAQSVQSACEERRPRSVLDVGTGTGILAIVAAICAAERVVGIDSDPRAVAVARRNAARNRVASCDFSTSPLSGVAQEFDLVVANIDLRTVIDLRRELTRVTARDGLLVVTGFLSRHSSDIEAAYREEGFVIGGRRVHEEWTLLELARASR